MNTTEHDRDILILFSDLVERRCNECAFQQAIPMKVCQERCALFGCKALPKLLSLPRADRILPQIFPNGSEKRRDYPAI